MPDSSVQLHSTNRPQADEEAEKLTDGSPWTFGQILPIGLAIGGLLGLITALLG